LTWTRIRGALIRFGWTFVLAFAAQPTVAVFMSKPAKFTLRELYVAALAALVYAAKKYAYPNTVL